MQNIQISDNQIVEKLKSDNQFLVKQVYEVAEHFGFETRNKYQILDRQSNPVFYVAEQQRGVFGFFMRQWFGHWRPYTLHFYNSRREKVMEAVHKFAFFFQDLSVYDSSGKHIGTFKQRFGILRRIFDVCDSNDRVLFQMKTGIRFFLLWNYPFYRRGRKVAKVSKKFSGIFTELATDKDNFEVDFESPDLTLQERLLVVASSIFIDLMYFEYKSD